MEQVNQYLDQFQKAESEQERLIIMEQYQAFLSTLSESDRDQARKYMQDALRPSIEENIKELDALVEKTNLVLKGKITYEGREYVLGDWVTIADYCRLYDFKPSRVQNWINKKIVPPQNVVVIPELNSLKLLKNIPYRPH